MKRNPPISLRDAEGSQKKGDVMDTEKNLYDLVIIGGGPAGRTSAALYMARAKYRVLVLEKAEIGGQITITSEIVNYPGVEKTNGKELTECSVRPRISVPSSHPQRCWI